MKRFLAIVLTLCMLISMSATFVSADAIHEDDVATLIEDSDVAPDPFYPFIHKEGRNYTQDHTDPYSGQGSHSFVYVSHTRARVQMYDANYDKQCDVHDWSRTLEEFYDRYPYFFGWVNHKPDGTASVVNNLYHKVCCSNTGCQAYIIEPHSQRIAGSNA